VKRAPFFELFLARHFSWCNASCAPALDLTPHFFEPDVVFRRAPLAGGSLVVRDGSRWAGARHFLFFLSVHVFSWKPLLFAQSGASKSSMCRKLVRGFTGPAGRGAADFLLVGGRLSELVFAPSVQRSGTDLGHSWHSLQKPRLAQFDRLRATIRLRLLLCWTQPKASGAPD
jgi:hypothetical protein